MAVYDLVRMSVKGNTRSAVRLLSISGLFLSLINHEVHKLSPPIETILIASQSSKAISPHDVHHLIKQMCDLSAAGDDAAQHILSLLTVLCSPGERHNKSFQDMALRIIFPPAGGASTAPGSSCSSVLFSSCFSAACDQWQLLLRPALKLAEAEVAPHEYRAALEEEFACLLQVFSQYNSDGDNYLDKEECRQMLEDLGLGGAALEDELDDLTGCEITAFVCWWWGHRKVYFSTSSTILNLLTQEESFSLLFTEEEALGASFSSDSFHRDVSPSIRRAVRPAVDGRDPALQRGGGDSILQLRKQRADSHDSNDSEDEEDAWSDGEGERRGGRGRGDSTLEEKNHVKAGEEAAAWQIRSFEEFKGDKERVGVLQVKVMEATAHHAMLAVTGVVKATTKMKLKLAQHHRLAATLSPLREDGQQIRAEENCMQEAPGLSDQPSRCCSPCRAFHLFYRRGSIFPRMFVTDVSSL